RSTRKRSRSLSRNSSSVKARARLNMLRSSSPRAERSSRSPPRGTPSRLRFIAANIGSAPGRCNPVTGRIGPSVAPSRVLPPTETGHLESDLAAWQDAVGQTGTDRPPRHPEHGGGRLRLGDRSAAPFLDGPQTFDPVPAHSGHPPREGARS